VYINRDVNVYVEKGGCEDGTRTREGGFWYLGCNANTVCWHYNPKTKNLQLHQERIQVVRSTFF